MGIQWFPGHMVKARKNIAESMPTQDVVLEVLDARMPLASENPDVTALRGHKHCVKILSKSDLADPERTKAWINYFESQVHPSVGNGLLPGKVLAVAITTERANETKAKIMAACKKLVPNPKGLHKAVRAIVIGIPNVGKSTLINTLANRKATKTGDKPAVTKGQQVITLDGLVLSDNPGIMSPKIEDQRAAIRLAFGGAIPDTALDYEAVAMWGAEYLRTHYPQLLMARFKLKSLPELAHDVLVEIGKRRGGLRAGGVVDMHKAADALIHDFRQGTIGRITLETPPMSAPETA